MNEAEREDWKAKLEATFRLPNETERYRVLDKQTDELRKIGPIIVRPENSHNCSDRRCEIDRWVMEEYPSHRTACWALKVGDNVFKPVWRIVLDVEI